MVPLKIKKDLSFRSAVPGDCRMFFDWRNDVIARKNSFDDKKISYKSHEEWFKKHLKDARCRMYVLLSGGTPVGQVRFDKHGKSASISVSIAPKMRGRSFGRKGIKLLSDHIIGDSYVDMIEAFIKHGNDASLKAFTASGYLVAEDECKVKGRQALKLVYARQGAAS